MTYVDFKNKTVFNASDLGKEYSAKGLIERMARRVVKEQEVFPVQRPNRESLLLDKKIVKDDFAVEKEKNLGLEKTIELLMDPIKENNYLSYRLLKKKKQKKSVRVIYKIFESRLKYINSNITPFF